MVHTIRYLHAALRFPTKPSLFSAIHNSSLTMFPGLTVANVANHFPKSYEMQKRHMK